MISKSLLKLARCPDDGGTLVRHDAAVACAKCGRQFAASNGYLDLRPRDQFAEQTKYLDESLHADARHASVSPPLLGSKIRNDTLRQFLKFQASDRVLDLGCGSGRTLVWNRSAAETMVGVDISPFFAREALDRVDLLLGDLRRLPFPDATFTKAWSLDVLEHLSPESLRDMLREANRVLAPGGALFVYTHVRKNGWLAGGTRAINRFARFLERRGWLDLTQERLRKSDHVNPLADHEDLARVVADAGFTIERIRYYTPIVGAFVENVIARGAEHAMARRLARAKGSKGTNEDIAKTVRAAAKATIAHKGPTYRAAQAMTAAMKLDLVLFGRVQSGPFFALLRKDAS